MSRVLDTIIGGEFPVFRELLKDEKECRQLIDDTCCNPDSEYCGDYAFSERCEGCMFFTPEDPEEVAKMKAGGLIIHE